jgi:hypothetical protein
MARSKPPVSYDDDVALPATPPNVGAFRPTPDQKASETEGKNPDDARFLRSRHQPSCTCTPPGNISCANTR